MSVCWKCSNTDNRVVFCTIDAEGRHHSYNDNPAIIMNIGWQYWYKHGAYHRHMKPAIVYNQTGYFFTDGFQESCLYVGKNIIVKNGTIDINNCVISGPLRYNNKIAVILKQLNKPYNNFYYCLIDNEKLFIQVL